PSPTGTLSTPSLHDALPIFAGCGVQFDPAAVRGDQCGDDGQPQAGAAVGARPRGGHTIEPLEHPLRLLRLQSGPIVLHRKANLADRKSTRLNSSHVAISYAV